MDAIKKKYDLVIIGGGTSGVAAAYTASKLGIKTLLVEKNVHLGGTITSGLVVPAMKTNDKGINAQFFNDLVEYAKKYNAQHTYIDDNKGWFNPELLKIVFDDMMNDAGCDVLYESIFLNASYSDAGRFVTFIKHKTLSIYIASDYLVDASADGILAKALGCEFLPENNEPQAPTLRFTMTFVDLNRFGWWVTKYDTNRNITTISETGPQTHLSTAYTWDDSTQWALKPLFKEAIAKGDLHEEDTAYFQVFTMPGMPDSITFNCPRIILKDENISDPFVYAKALKQGRKKVYRIANFCKKYLPGFEDAYISNIADMLGVRESNRVKGKYVYAIEDMIMKKNFDNVALSSDYPIDIHSSQKNGSKLNFPLSNYYLPIESLISEKYDNLFIIGRCLSATFEAQAALRVQKCCFSMGEAVAKHIDRIRKLSPDKTQ